jgi:hypothetical protein
MFEIPKRSFKYYLWMFFVCYCIISKTQEILMDIIPDSPFIIDAITAVVLITFIFIDYGRDYDAETQIRKAYLKGLENSEK